VTATAHDVPPPSSGSSRSTDAAGPFGKVTGRGADGSPDVAVGWFPDPFGRHEIRWFSQGRPTSMVRDGNVESHDHLDAGVRSGRADAPS
jgi:hypothetical protein